jgi:glycosyltransferase involved in cell wall biosynthesis
MNLTADKSPRVTVIIPAYNAIRYIAETMETVITQTYQDFEVLIVNDGSTDDTPNWVSQFCQQEAKVRMISQVNKGLPGARNTGIKESRGEYIAILDADDLWEPTKLQKQVDSLDSHPEAGLCYTWTALADSEGKATGRVVTSHAEGKVWQQLTEINFVCCGSTPMIRRHCFETVGFFAEDLLFSEDWDMWLRIAAKYPFVVVKEPLIRYRQHSNNMTKNCQKMLETSRVLIERNFASAPTELLHLKNRSYGCIYLFLAWKATENRDYQQAIEFRDQAIAHRPQLLFSAKCIRLNIAILIQRWLGANFYVQVQEFIFSIRRRGIGAVDR